MKKMLLIVFTALLPIALHSQIVVPLVLPDNCNYNVGNQELPVSEDMLIKILPNPNSGIFTLQIESPSAIGNTQIIIYNAVGVKCFQMPVYSDSKKMIRKMDIKGLPNGVYFLKVSTGNKEANATFNIQK